MGFWLNLFIFIGLIAPICKYYLYYRNYEGNRLSREYFRKFTGGLRYFILPAVCVHILLTTNLRIFCVALACMSIFNICLKLIFGSNRPSRKTDALGYFSYAFLYLTWVQNDPYWIQIWPTIIAVLGLTFVLTAIYLNKYQWLMPYWVEKMGPMYKLQIKIIFPASALYFIIGNEYFRRFTSLESWAFYNAFSYVFLVLIIGLCTVIVVPAIGEERLAAYEDKLNSD